MPRRYNRKTERQTFDQDAMEQAINACSKGEMGYLKASQQFNVPICSLRRRVNNTNKRAIGSTKYIGGKVQSLPPEIEEELVKYIIEMDRKMFGLTLNDVRKMAYELAIRNNIPAEQHRFNEDKKIAGKDWLLGFRKRHPSLSLRCPEPTSMARAQGFTKEKVSEFFNLLKETYDEFHWGPEQIFNVDETGVTTVQGKLSKVLSLRGKRQVGAIKSAERGSNVTVCCTMSASGVHLPPVIIFPRKRIRQELTDAAPPGSLILSQERGWMNSDLFLKYLQHFVHHVKPSISSKVLLILDGHHTHKTAAAVDFCLKHGIVLLCLPPHTTHKLQPLDVSFFKSFNCHYDRAVENWLRNHPGRVLTIHQIPQLVNDAFGKSASVVIAQNGFRKTGIFPFDDDIFGLEEFASESMPTSEVERTITTPSDIFPVPEIKKPLSKRSGSATLCTRIVDFNQLDEHGNTTIFEFPSTFDASGKLFPGLVISCYIISGFSLNRCPRCKSSF